MTHSAKSPETEKRLARARAPAPPAFAWARQPFDASPDETPVIYAVRRGLVHHYEQPELIRYIVLQARLWVTVGDQGAFVAACNDTLRTMTLDTAIDLGIEPHDFDVWRRHRDGVPAEICEPNWTS